MSLVENDMFQFYWNMPPSMVFLATALLGTGAIWLIELYRCLPFKDPRKTRPPLGLAIFRWRTNWQGDLVFLPATVTLISVYYDRMEVSSSFWTSGSFFILPLLVGVSVTTVFILMEESKKAYPTGKKININRVYHSVYFCWMAYMLAGFAIRWFVYREEVPFLIVALGSFSLWVRNLVDDGREPNFLWKKITKAYPGRKTHL